MWLSIRHVGHQNFVFVVVVLVRWLAFDLHFFLLDFGVFCFALVWI